MADSSSEKKEGKKEGKKFEVKKWNAVALWAWGAQFNESTKKTMIASFKAREFWSNNH